MGGVFFAAPIERSIARKSAGAIKRNNYDRAQTKIKPRAKLRENYMSTQTVQQSVPETVGRKYKATWFEVHSRKVGGADEKWFGFNHYKTEGEARANIDSMGQRYVNLGGLTMDCGPATDLFEYRIVRKSADCEIVHVETKKV